MRQDSLTSGRGTAWMTPLLFALPLVCGIGCTMCPAPFDYSGTVPGAADQNDFRVRNNGILPIWRRPRPWPPVVSNEADDHPETHTPTAEPTPKASRLIVAAGKKPPREEAGSILTATPADSDVTPVSHADPQEATSSGVAVAGFFKDSMSSQDDTPKE